MLDKYNDKSGFALLSVLLFILIASAIITPLVLAARTDFLVASRSYLVERQTILTQGIGNAVAWQISNWEKEQNDSLVLDSTPIRTICGVQQIVILIQDQASLINLNAVPVVLLEGGFSALGFDSSEADMLANLAIAFKDKENNNKPKGSDEIVGGLKRDRFEAIEELYEFPGFVKMPVAMIGKVFTVYGGRNTVNSLNMSDLLSEILPDSPGGSYPNMVHREEKLKFVRIEVFAENPNLKTRGFSGKIIEIPEQLGGEIIDHESTTNPDILVSDGNNEQSTFDVNVDCSDVFGDELAQWISIS